MTATRLGWDLTRERTGRARALMRRTRTERFAVGAFNADNVETLRAICRAAQVCAAPVLIELSQTEVEAIGLANARAVLDNEIAELGIEAYLNLDHAPSLEAGIEAIDAGFEFVHLDCFQRNPDAREDAITEETRQLVAYARTTGALVEGEMQYLRGRSTLHREAIDPTIIAASVSDPERARRFVARTGVDTFAIGIGNVHGRYPERTRLRFDALKSVRDAIDVNISVHGGSNTSNRDYRAMARSGVSKINVNSDIRFAYRTALESEFATHREEYATVKLMGPVLDAVQRVVENKICAFGSLGRMSRDAFTGGAK